MAEFIAVARQYGDSVQFPLEADDIKDARIFAKTEARRIFDYKGQGDDPSVSVRQVQEKD